MANALDKMIERAWSFSRTTRPVLPPIGAERDAGLLVVGMTPALGELEPFTHPTTRPERELLDHLGEEADGVRALYLVRARPQQVRSLSKVVPLWLPVLAEEIRRQRPRAVLLLGEPVARAVLGSLAGDLELWRHIRFRQPKRKMTWHVTYAPEAFAPQGKWTTRERYLAEFDHLAILRGVDEYYTETQQLSPRFLQELVRA